MYQKITIVVFICFALILFRCAKAPNFSNVPEISFQSFDKTTLLQSDLNRDSIFVSLNFKDGDGDISAAPDSKIANLIVIDRRTQKEYASYNVPTIPEKGANNGIEGTMLIKLFSTCCIFPENIPPCVAPPKYPTNQLSLEIYLIDKAGNKSNVIQTPDISLLCQ